MQTLNQTLQDVRLGEAGAHANLTLVRFLAQSRAPAYHTLDQRVCSPQTMAAARAVR